VQHIRCGCFEVVRYTNSARIKLERRAHDFPTFYQWQPREIAPLVHGEIEDEEVNASPKLEVLVEACGKRLSRREIIELRAGRKKPHRGTQELLKSILEKIGFL
jgi:hypothetical protein